MTAQNLILAPINVSLLAMLPPKRGTYAIILTPIVSISP